MFEVKRFGKTLGKIIGNRDLARTKARVEKDFGKGCTLVRVL